jgi:hypothetical protein
MKCGGLERHIDLTVFMKTGHVCTWKSRQTDIDSTNCYNFLFKSLSESRDDTDAQINPILFMKY